jgi:hypothetical protein
MDFHVLLPWKLTISLLIQLNETGLTQMTWNTTLQRRES